MPSLPLGWYFLSSVINVSIERLIESKGSFSKERLQKPYDIFILVSKFEDTFLTPELFQHFINPYELVYVGGRAVND